MPIAVNQDRTADASAAGESAIVARAKEDRRAFAPLYRRYVGPVYQYCYRRLGTRDAAEDATSAVFMKALAALPTCQDDAFRSWLFRIAHNVVVDRYRHRAVRSDQPLATVGDRRDDAPTPEELVLSADEDLAIRHLLSRLTPDQRQVLELRLAGLTGAEIARALDRSHASVRMLQTRAAARLRTILTETDHETDVAERRNGDA